MDAAYIDRNAAVCGVCFSEIASEVPQYICTAVVKGVAEYMPGSFYLRELPCLQKVIERVKGEPDLLIIDGYVWLPGGRAGLGARLFQAMDEKLPVIGIAKSPFRGQSLGKKVFRGRSMRPLYVTSAGIEECKSAEMVREMRGRYRVPDMMRIADMNSRRLARKIVSDHRLLASFAACIPPFA